MNHNTEDFMRIIRNFSTSLSEHFDAVQVLACRLDTNGNTDTFYVGSGLWPARTGMAREFLDQQDREDLAYSIADATTSFDDEDEDDDSFDREQFPS